MIHIPTGMEIFGVSPKQLREQGGAYVAVRKDKGKPGVLIGVGSSRFPTSGWMPAEEVSGFEPADVPAVVPS